MTAVIVRWRWQETLRIALSPIWLSLEIVAVTACARLAIDLHATGYHNWIV